MLGDYCICILVVARRREFDSSAAGLLVISFFLIRQLYFPQFVFNIESVQTECRHSQSSVHFIRNYWGVLDKKVSGSLDKDKQGLASGIVSVKARLGTA